MVPLALFETEKSTRRNSFREPGLYGCVSPRGTVHSDFVYDGSPTACLERPKAASPIRSPA